MSNYFQLYNIPESFKPDAAVVKSKFFELSRKYHPDRFSQASEDEQAVALQQSAENNTAYRVLTHADKLMAYILKINNLLEDEEKYSLPPAFLMEMMDLNELVEEYEADPSNATLRQKAYSSVEEAFGALNEALEPLCASYNQDSSQKHLLIKIKDYYFRKKYLLRIQERINTFALR